jgi:hypothetical protein
MNHFASNGIDVRRVRHISHADAQLSVASHFHVWHVVVPAFSNTSAALKWSPAVRVQLNGLTWFDLEASLDRAHLRHAVLHLIS